MARHNPIQTNGTAGEISPLALGRVDISRYGNAYKRLNNCIIKSQGAIRRRQGTHFAAEVKDSSKKTRLVEFQFSDVQAYMLEFGDQYIRVFMNEASVESSPGTLLEVTTPYLESELADLRFTQSADVLYISHGKHAPRKLSRTSHTSWTLTVIDFIDGPFLDTNATDTTLSAGAVSGSAVTVTASAALFAATDVGRLIRIKASSKWGWGVITGFTDTTHVTVNVRKAFDGTAAVKAWRLGAWSDARGWPTCVTFHDQRLTLASTDTQPQTTWMSNSGIYETFSPTEEDDSVTDSNTITFTIASNKVNKIMWLDSGTTLLIGTIGEEWQTKPTSTAEPLSPDNIQLQRQTTHGASRVRSIRIGSSTLFITRSGRKLRELYYDFSTDSIVSKELSLLSEHLLREKGSKVVDCAYQQEPDSIYWAVRSDGGLAGMSYLREQEVIGWHRHIMGGSFNSGNAMVESVACIPNPEGTADQLWMIVKRTINGQTKRYIEFLEDEFLPEDPQDKAGMRYADCGLLYEGAPATTISGLDHLIGQTVAICADGSARPDRVVSETGTIQLDRPASRVWVGLPFSSKVTLLPPEGGGQAGTAQGKSKRVHEATLRLLDTIGFWYGPGESVKYEKSFRASSDPMDVSPPLFTGDKKIELNGGYDTEGIFTIEQRQPYPFTLLAVMPEGVVYQ